MSKVRPPRSKWALGLFCIAALLAISGIAHEVREFAEPREWNPYNTLAGGLREILVVLIPSAFTAVVGIMIQYLADIRWASLRKLEDDDA